ncbi:MAG: sulfite exporter TauE/SafE family protein [Sulfurimicrobium sp.]|nr:sulfite exporter TauE/SafE family protein [Sulfurimicrobium sp.]
MDWMYTVAGLGVGFIVGLTGMGGGALMTPLLVLFFGVAPSVAVGTDLLYAAITKLGGVWVHGRRGSVEWKIAGLLALGSVPAALATIALLKAFAVNTRHFESVIMTALGVALILTALALLFKERLRNYARRNAPENQTDQDWKWLDAATIATGAVLGVVVTVTSIGAGAMGAVALFFLYPRLSAVKIVGTDLAHAVPLTAVAGMGHFYLGTVDVALLLSLLLGSLPGIYLGSHLGTRVPEHVLRPVLAGMLILIGGRLVW